MTDRRWWLVGGVALTAIVAVLSLVTILAPTAPTRSYAEFLDDVAAGRVQTVTQQGERLDVETADGRYVVQAPSILTDVFGDVQAATNGEVPAFSAIPAADTDWLALWPAVAANLALVIALVALAVTLQRRRPGPST